MFALAITKVSLRENYIISKINITNTHNTLQSDTIFTLLKVPWHENRTL